MIHRSTDPQGVSVRRAVPIDVHGGPETLIVREVPEPPCGPAQVLVRTVASTLNPVDWKTRTGDVGPALPATLGWDLATHGR